MYIRTYFFCVLILAASFATSCRNPETEPPEEPPPAGPLFDPKTATATVTGKISFQGTPPPNEKVQMSADPYCQQHASEYPTLETVRVSDGGLENAIVYVSKGTPQARYVIPGPIELDQKNCHYIPHVLTMMTGQQLKIKNSDNTLHNIHAFGQNNPQFNQGQPVIGMVNETVFKNPEVAVPIRCDVHRWMNSFVGVFNHPFHTVTKQGGTFELKLPPGKYELTTWHEKYCQKTMTVEIAGNEKKEVGVSYSANDKAD
jgi:plastocyanin